MVPDFNEGTTTDVFVVLITVSIVEKLASRENSIS
jgi:hypothetical protein